jgi:ribosomal protein S18 acetylase RimI-like enzyme
MNVTVRQASEADAGWISSLNADVQEIHAAALPGLFKAPSADSFPPEMVAALIRAPENLIFLAELDVEPVGYAYAEVIRRPETAFRTAQEMVHLHHISVRPAHRRKGIGDALIRSVRAAAGDHGISLLAVDVWTFNEAARRFFRRQGFNTRIERLWNQ